MLKKVIAYEDFDGNQRTETHYFNLTRVELAEMAFNLPDGISDAIGDNPAEIDETKAASRIVASLGQSGVLDYIKELVKKSYGVKSPDGKYFDKDPKHFKEFASTLAYDSLIIGFMEKPETATDFVNAVIVSSANKKTVQLPASN